MSAKRYALEAVESLRRGQRGEAELELTRAQQELGQAETALVRAQQALSAQRDRAASIGATLRALGESSGLELQRIATHAARETFAAQRLQAACVHATACVRQRRAALEQAQHALAHARGHERVIERDRERWQGEQRRQQARDEQLELEERVPSGRAERTRGS